MLAHPALPVVCPRPCPLPSRLPCAEIQSYLKQVAQRHRLVESNVLRLRTKVADATWSASTQSWDLILHSLADDDMGREVVAHEYRVRSRFLVCATGKLIIPARPNLPGLESFQGAAFHTAQWDHSVDLRVRGP